MQLSRVQFSYQVRNTSLILPSFQWELWTLIPDRPAQPACEEEKGKQSEGKLGITETGRDSGAKRVKNQEWRERKGIYKNVVDEVEEPEKSLWGWRVNRS